MRTNEERAEQVEGYLLDFAEETGLDADLEADGPATVAGDMISQILHWVTMKTGSWETALYAMRCGIGHYVTEQNITDPEDELGPVTDVQIQAVCNGVVWATKTGEGVPFDKS
ncbi:hypothetical protein [Hyphomicrobium sp.]|uniref:hypothetical protein n=1 Tax=Hyphomicrobium sp. TaxID=82 RepID=UPI001D1BCB4F|nr:hypothetical protein [Hyphomicrobium sp.]MBY0560149.1 hypothetical protein [Hyphomicrobium sp.]